MRSRAKLLYRALYTYVSIMKYTSNKEPYIFQGFFHDIKNVTYSFPCICTANPTTNWYNITTPRPTLNVKYNNITSTHCGWPPLRIVCTMRTVDDIEWLSITT